MNKTEILVDQLESTSAMLAVLLEDIYEIAPNSVKDRVCEEIGKINNCIRRSGLEWQPIETAPKDGMRILVCRKELIEPVTIGYWSMVECRFVTPLVFEYHPPTHWMPLPEVL